MIEHLANIIDVSSTGSVITYPFFRAFIHLLNNIELVKKIYLTCAKNDPTGQVNKGQFLKEAQQFSSQITPYEVNILFSMIKEFRDDGYSISPSTFFVCI
jgi:hypothetical protein